MLLYFFFFFFNDTAPTGIYTYSHTLSLHDALPIYSHEAYVGIARCDEPQAASWIVLSTQRMTLPVSCAMRPYSVAVLRQIRSEEHTSELQSLMRISYAVFCLKQQNRVTPHTNTSQPQ